MGMGRVGPALASMAAAALIVGLAGTALAQGAPQGPPPQNLRGEVKAVNGNDITLAERSGQTITLHLAENTPVGVLVPAKMEDIKQGIFIGTAATPLPDGRLRAQEILIFRPGFRPGEGHGPYDLTPDSTMTNADVDGIVTGSSGNELKLKYKDGEKTLVVPPGTPIVTQGQPDKSQLKPGAQAMVVGQKQADGSYNVVRISVGKDGMKPPM